MVYWFLNVTDDITRKKTEDINMLLKQLFEAQNILMTKLKNAWIGRKKQVYHASYNNYTPYDGDGFQGQPVRRIKKEL